MLLQLKLVIREPYIISLSNLFVSIFMELAGLLGRCQEDLKYILMKLRKDDMGIICSKINIDGKYMCCKNTCTNHVTS